MRRFVVALVMMASLSIPAAALGHAGDYNTQIQNATKYCIERYSGCSFQNSSPYPESHMRYFLFTRKNTSSNGQTCYNQFGTNHHNVVVSNSFVGCF